MGSKNVFHTFTNTVGIEYTCPDQNTIYII